MQKRVVVMDSGRRLGQGGQGPREKANIGVCERNKLRGKKRGEKKKQGVGGKPNRRGVVIHCTEPEGVATLILHYWEVES